MPLTLVNGMVISKELPLTLANGIGTLYLITEAARAADKFVACSARSVVILRADTLAKANGNSHEFFSVGESRRQFVTVMIC